MRREEKRVARRESLSFVHVVFRNRNRLAKTSTERSLSRFECDHRLFISLHEVSIKLFPLIKKSRRRFARAILTFLSTMMAAPPPSIIVGNALIKGNVVANEEWRTFGEARRRELLENDKEGRSFTITRSVSLKRYISIGDRVSAV